jgi:hypothetical protein
MKKRKDVNKSTIEISGLNVFIKGFKINIPAILFIVSCGWLVWSSLKQTLLNNKLKSENNKIRGIVTDKYKVGGKGTIQINYLFKLDGNTYFGSTTNEKYAVGDSLYILFLKEDPQCNKSFSFLYE